MVRAPCCQKMGLKKGPWTCDEDRILINHVTLHGHDNWRALPKQAAVGTPHLHGARIQFHRVHVGDSGAVVTSFVQVATYATRNFADKNSHRKMENRNNRSLLRCGKSCRLRWTNYLRPDIKRGNFSEEEEETIINLHEVLGNRWSAIAAKLPGRTDNEIKNVWNTHLKKRIKKVQESNASDFKKEDDVNAEESREIKCTTPSKSENQEDIYQPNSPQQQSSITTTTTATTSVEDNSVSNMDSDALVDFLQGDDTFWSEVFSTENSGSSGDYFLADNSGTATSEFSGYDFHLQFLEFDGNHDILNMKSDFGDSFWYDTLTNLSGQLPEL